MTRTIRRLAAAALLLSATMLAGCATNRTPQFSYDADVPPLPTVAATVTDERRTHQGRAAILRWREEVAAISFRQALIVA